MTLQRTKKRTSKAIKLLTDPEPQFVSLVSNGANQTPFKAVKNDGLNDSEVVVAGVRATDTLTEESEDAMAGKKQSKKLVVRTDKATGEVSLQKLVFSADNFDSEKAVRSYLDDNGYEGGDINQLDDKGFEVIAADEADFDGVQVIKGDDGVERHVGVVKAEESEDTTETATKSDGESGDQEEAETETTEEAETETTEETTEESVEETTETAEETEEVTKDDGEKSLAKKYSSWWAEYSEATSIKEVMKSGADGLPPAIYELNDAMYTAMRNAINAGDLDKVPVIVSEFGTLVVEITKLFDFATLPAEEVQKMLGESEDKEVATKSAEQQPTVDVDDIVAKVMKQVEEKMQNLVDADSLQLVSKSVTDGNEATQSLQQELEKAVKTIGEQASSIEEMQKTIKAQASSIENLEGVATVSRSLDDEMGQHTRNEDTVKTTKSDEIGSSLLNNELGMG